MVRHPTAVAGSADHGRGGVRQALIADDQLWTVSTADVMATDTARFAQRAWIPFP
jgi:hypothetical protein